MDRKITDFEHLSSGPENTSDWFIMTEERDNKKCKVDHLIKPELKKAFEAGATACLTNGPNEIEKDFEEWFKDYKIG